MSGTGTPAVLLTPALVASEILETLITDLKIRSDDYVYESALRIAFELRGLPIEDIRAGLEYAEQQGWLSYRPDMRVYMLTEKGFAQA